MTHEQDREGKTDSIHKTQICTGGKALQYTIGTQDQRNTGRGNISKKAEERLYDSVHLTSLSCLRNRNCAPEMRTKIGKITKKRQHSLLEHLQDKRKGSREDRQNRNTNYPHSVTQLDGLEVREK